MSDYFKVPSFSKKFFEKGIVKKRMQDGMKYSKSTCGTFFFLEGLKTFLGEEIPSEDLKDLVNFKENRGKNVNSNTKR